MAGEKESAQQGGRGRSGALLGAPLEPAASIPLRFLGMGLLIAWLSCTHISLIFPGPDADLAMRNNFDLGMRLGDLTTFVVLALAARRLGVLSDHPRLLWLAVGLCTAGSLAEGLWILPATSSQPLNLAVSALTAVGGAFLFCLWGQIYSCMGKTQAITYGALSCVAALAASALVYTMREPFAIVATSAFPLLSLGCALASVRQLPPEHPADARQRYPLPWKLFAIMALGGLISGVSGSFMPTVAYMGSIHRITATGLFGVLTLGLVAVSRKRQDARMLAVITVPIALASLLLIPFAEGWFAYAVSFLAKLAFIFFTFLMLLIMTRIVHRFSVPSLRLFALTRFFTELPLLAGVLAQRWLMGSGLVSDMTVRVAMCLGGIVLLLICILIWKSEKSVNDDWGAAGVTIEGSVHTPTEAERIERRADELGRRFDLTRREQEIMLLVAQGKTRAQIEAELFLSENTVKTHIRHGYAKMGIHSKEEARALFDETS